MSQPLNNRHDLLILFDVVAGNPNGDPDAGNMPRVDPTSNLGLVSDVCLKRKVRNYVMACPPSPNGHDKSFSIMIQQGNILNKLIKKASDEYQKPEQIRDALCREFYDVRTFGAVVSTGSKDDPMKGSPYGQIRGPVQFTFGRSFHPVTPIEITITRCAVTKEEDQAKERTMGQKYIVPYALYAAKCYVSPAFAKITGFDQQDFDLLLEALQNLFENDRSAARGEMIVRALYDFEHVGDQHQSNPVQNARAAMLGCAPAHKLFETVQVTLDPTVAVPSSFSQYTVTDRFQEANFPGVKLHRHITSS